MKALDEMIGKSCLYKKDDTSHTFLSYKMKGEEVTIVTDREWFVKHVSEVPLFLDWFIPAKSELSVYVDNKSHFEHMKATIQANIKMVQLDKAYIPQATEVNNQIKSLIEIGKMEIEAFKLIKGK